MKRHIDILSLYGYDTTTKVSSLSNREQYRDAAAKSLKNAGEVLKSLHAYNSGISIEWTYISQKKK